VRLGYFPNITHAPAIVAIEQGFLAEELGRDVAVETRSFNAGSPCGHSRGKTRRMTLA